MADPKIIRKSYGSSEIKAVEGERSLIVKISTVNPDRSNDVVLPQGFLLDNYFKNPVVAWGHKYGELPIAKTTEIQITEDGVLAKAVFPDEGEYPFADVCYRLAKKGFLNTWSIGFIPKKWTDRPEGGREYQEIELLEYSAVLVPDNPEAVTVMREFGADELMIQKGFTGEEEDENENEEAEENEATQEVVEKDVAETISLAMLADHVKFIMERFNENGVSLEVIEKMQQALSLILECVKVEAEIGKKEFVYKEGRVLSGKNRKLISDSVTKMQDAVVAMKELLEATEASKEQEGEKAAPTDETLSFIQSLQKQLRKTDKEVGLQLRALNDYLKSSNSDLKGGEKENE
jgi:uncharacterized protein